MSISPAELDELEAVESWVSLMAQLEETEHEHLMSLSLRYTDKQKLDELRHKVMTKQGARSAKSALRGA